MKKRTEVEMPRTLTVKELQRIKAKQDEEWGFHQLDIDKSLPPLKKS